MDPALKPPVLHSGEAGAETRVRVRWNLGTWVTGALLSVIWVRRRGRGYEFHGLAALASGRWFALLALAGYSAIFAATVVRSPLWSPLAGVDEQVIYYQAARNFVTYGFRSSGFLHDLSTSADAAHHPYVYSHMPPGPDILLAVLFKIFGERYGLVRLVLAALFMAGMVCFLAFARLLLRAHGLSGWGYAMLFVSPLTVLQSIDHPAYSLFPLFAFFPVVALHRHYATGRWLPYVLALLAILAASLYVVALHLVLFVCAWAMLGLLRLIRFDLRDFAAFVVLAVAGVVLHLLQGMVVLGPIVFFQELAMTLANRISGYPTVDEVIAFYRAHDLVLHGYRFNLLQNLKAWNTSLEFPGRAAVIGLAVLVVLWGVLRVGRYDPVARIIFVPADAESAPVHAGAALFARLGAWAAVSIITPLLLFPAYTGDYGLGGRGELLLGVGAAAVVAYTARELLADPARWAAVEAPAVWMRRAAWGACGLALTLCLVAVVASQLDVLKAAVRAQLGPHPYVSLPVLARGLRGQVVMTNVYPTTVGFFTRAAVLGGCGPDALDLAGRPDPSRCHAVFVKGFGRGARVVPTHYVLFRKFRTFTPSPCEESCLEGLEARLAVTHRRVLDTGLFAVFALDG
jgi:hypothetical protein